MRRVALSLLLLVGAAGSGRTQPTPKELFLSASAAFARGDYVSAERNFAACRRALGDDPVVDFDLAMAHLRLEQLGRARVYLERARRLAPRDRATREELRRLLARLDQPSPPSPSWLHALWESARDALTYREALALATAAELAAALLLGAWLLTGRRRWAAAAVVAGVLLALMAPLGVSKVAEQLGGRRALVVAANASVRGGPGEEFGELAAVAEGAGLRLVERPRLSFGPGLSLRAGFQDQGFWCEVRTAAGVRGYVRRSLIEPL